MDKHTPGPWYVDSVFPDKDRGHTFDPRVWVGAYSHQDGCKVRLADIPDCFAQDDEQMANARLIAAAPALLAALEALIGSDVVPSTPSDYVRRGYDSFKGWEQRLIAAQNKARAAICAAKGESNG